MTSRIIRANYRRLANSSDRDNEFILPLIRMRGRYKIEAVRPDGRVRVLADWFNNLITDAGLDYIGANGSEYSNCCVGSGNTAPTNGDTTLVAFIGNTGNIISSTGTLEPTTPYFGTRTNIYQFAQGAAAGNLAEVGVSHTTNGTALWSRALILDGSGSPTTITVLGDEFLNVTYQLQLYPELGDVTGTVVINGITYDWTARSANAGTSGWTPTSTGDSMAHTGHQIFSGPIGAITAIPSGTRSTPDSVAQGTYTSGSLTTSSTQTYGLTSGNFTLPGGVTSLAFSAGASTGNNGTFQIGFTDGSGNGVPKDGSSILTLTQTVTWGRGTS